MAKYGWLFIEVTKYRRDKISERQSIERQNIEVTKYRTQNIELAKYRTQNIVVAKYRRQNIEHEKWKCVISKAKVKIYVQQNARKC